MRTVCVIILLHLTLATAAKFKLNNLLLRHVSSLNVSKDVKEKWIEQPLDHFDPHETRTFYMKYFENLHLWQPNGPIYVFLGGEDKQVPCLVSTEYMNLLPVQLAKDSNGAMFATEHRYYGNSVPNLPKGNKIEYYKFLSSKQALADIAHFIKTLKSDSKYSQSAVVVIGGSYSGNLAVWMREKYPDLVDAAVALSAPVLAKKDYHEYLDTVRDTFEKYGTKDCLTNMENKFREVEKLLQNASGIAKLKKELHICEDNDLTLLENQQCLYHKMYFVPAVEAQYGTVQSVKNLCDIYTYNNEKLGADHHFHGIGSSTSRHGDLCTNVNNCFKYHGSSSGKAWTYQYCTEFGYLQTSSSEKQPFVHWNPLQFLFKSCIGFVEGDIEKTIDEGVAKTNEMYGGKTPNVTKVVFPHGDMDPWHALGIVHDLGPDAPAFIVNETSHCSMLIETQDEPEEMKEKRKYVRDLIKKWISK